MKRLFIPACAALALTACGQQGDYSATEERLTTVDVAEAPADDAAGGESPVSIPQIAYVYEYGFRVAAREMAPLQERHVALCEKLGPRQCQVLEMRSSGDEGDYAYGSLNLAVAADKARAFGAQLATTAGEAGGEQVSSAITGEDLSKQIVDTEARLRARTALRDRLMEVLETRRGTVAELVEAERGVAQVNEEIDQARSWLAEMRGRVDFSRVNVQYQSGTPSGGGFVEPIRRAFGSIGSVLGNVIAALIVLATVAVPVGLVVWLGLLGWRRVRPKKKPAADTES
ncbi:DUF4349 domain-containing protein [Aurantiacibacter xanthus]|uniref:DUF4349 domain-containing protein n=1 Tax=Aurantiacibacter xanthus TaxID=1784712 RepID=A0A3A1PEP7_9SPHN|nr:DUF4349 domain-containing protein [Aurantiacibacter xanthus]RIV92260.1 DUF4349 domain-containing protein [Aurantiacibacter xanthus]